MQRQLIFASSLLLVVGAGASAACLPSQPSVVRLSGVLERITFAGPPNYEGVRSGDAPETCFVLKLPHRICMQDPVQGHASAKRLQLLLTPPEYARYRARLGSRISLSGQLWAAESGHHHTPIMFTPAKGQEGR